LPYVKDPNTGVQTTRAGSALILIVVRKPKIVVKKKRFCIEIIGLNKIVVVEKHIF